MPFSFSRLFLGKKATIIDEDSLPCQPREIVPVVVDANPVTSKTKFGLTKIGRALKHKFHLVSVCYPSNRAYVLPAIIVSRRYIYFLTRKNAFVAGALLGP
jgi:hypothetical protein